MDPILCGNKRKEAKNQIFTIEKRKKTFERTISSSENGTPDLQVSDLNSKVS